MGMCVAMWSGPRNISTAMMRAWENRSDCHVVDEPFYAHFLEHTGIDHPMAKEILEHNDPSLEKALALVSTPPTNGVFYQKHISTHMLDHIPLDWMADVLNVFLIRDPRFMVASYSVKRKQGNTDDLGYARLKRLFEKASSYSEETPIVIDSLRFLNDPEQHLKYICEHLKIPFEAAMLNWPKGARGTDGIWHKHWYDSVKASTGFTKPRTQLPQLNPHQQKLANECMPHYEYLSEHAFTV